MARNTRGILTKAQLDAWKDQKKPYPTFKYRGRTLQSPMPGLYDDVKYFGRGVTVDPNWKPEQLEKAAEKIAEAQEKAEAEIKELKARAIDLWKKDVGNTMELGKTLLQIKTMVGHGNFMEWCEKAGLKQNRVSYCMRVAAPEGNKVKESKERNKRTPRAKALGTVTKKLAALYDLCNAEKVNEDQAEQLYDEIVADIKDRFMAAMSKAKAKGAAA